MGGVVTDLDGRTTIPRLFAAGEVACTGVHGANRLASNSLLEGLVFGARAGRAMRECGNGRPARHRNLRPLEQTPEKEPHPIDIPRIAWEKCGIVRDGEGLREACALFEHAAGTLVPWLIARCALAREESRGAHFRADFPAKRPEFQKHSIARKGSGIEFRDKMVVHE
jgi:L-aspartate oxidase